MSDATHLPAADFEPQDAPPKPLLLVGAGLAAGILAVLGVSLALYVGRYHDREFQQHLGTYAWLDRDSGIVRIPIDRAMQRLVEESRAPQDPTP